MEEEGSYSMHVRLAGLDVQNSPFTVVLAAERKGGLLHENTVLLVLVVAGMAVLFICAIAAYRRRQQAFYKSVGLLEEDRGQKPYQAMDE